METENLILFMVKLRRDNQQPTPYAESEGSSLSTGHYDLPKLLINAIPAASRRSTHRVQGV